MSAAGPRLQRDLSAPVDERRFEVGSPWDGKRIDAFLADQLAWASRSRVQELIAAGRVWVLPFRDPGPVPARPRAGTRIRTGQQVVVHFQSAGARPSDSKAAPAITVLYEDERLLAVAKPAGTSVYPSPRHRHGSLLEEVHRRWRTSGGVGAPPTPCHRLDRDTSGLLLLAKDRAARAAVGRQLEARTVRKVYLAWVAGRIDAAEGRIDLALGRDKASRVELRQGPCHEGEGQQAVTLWRRLRVERDRCLVELAPKTGRQHQLRVHLAAIGHPILGDRLYLGGDDLFLASLDRELRREEIALLGAPRLALHAWRLELVHPSGRLLEVVAPPPPDFESISAARGAEADPRSDAPHEDR